MKFVENKKPEIKEKEYIKTVHACLNPQDNGGETVSLEVDYFDNGDVKRPGVTTIYTNIHLTSHCYGVHSTKQSLWGISLDQLHEAVSYMLEVEKRLEIGA